MEDQLTATDVDSGWYYYTLAGVWGAELFTWWSVNGDWYIRYKCITTGFYVPFWTSGPNNSQC